MDMARSELIEVLRAARALLASPGNDFVWSSWECADEALREMDWLIEVVEVGRLPERHRLSLLFAPTGPIQEVSISSGWGIQFLAVAERFDGALARVYGVSPQ
jgi:hypothetical protein